MLSRPTTLVDVNIVLPLPVNVAQPSDLDERLDRRQSQVWTLDTPLYAASPAALITHVGLPVADISRYSASGVDASSSPICAILSTTTA